MADQAKIDTSWWGMTKQAAADWMEDKATKLAAALAFYTMLSIAPLLILTIKIIGMVASEGTARKQIENYLVANVGSKGWEAVKPMLDQAGQEGAGIVATVVSVAVLLFSASGVFGELQDSLNTVWEVKPKPNQGIWATIKQRFFSFTLVLGVAFLLLVSLVGSTILSGMADRLGGGESTFWKAVHFVVSISVITALFTLMFRYLPDVRVRWRNLWVGAAITAVLFTIGKFLLGWYLGRGSTTNIYGAAGSLVALLLWVYYAAQILFFGAEFTQVYARAHGDEMRPLPNSVKVTEEDRAQQGMASPERVAAKAAAASSPSPSPLRAPATGVSRSAGARPYRLPSAPPRVVNVPVPQYGGVGGDKRSYVLAGAGLVVGAIAGALGATNLKKDPTRVTRKHAAAVHLDERIRAIESKLGRVSRLREYLEDLSVSDRIDQVEKKVRSAKTTLRSQQTGRPWWAVRLGEMIAGR